MVARRLKPVLLLLLFVLLAHGLSWAERRAGASRPAGGGRSGGTATVARSPGGGQVTHARGRATYGYARGGRGYGYGYGYRPYYPRYRFGFYYGYGYPGLYPYYGFYYPGYVYPSYYPTVRLSSPAARVETRIRPKKATVLVDGEAMGQGKDYSGTWDALYLRPGDHAIEFSAPGYQRLSVALRAAPGASYLLEFELSEGTGLDARSTGLDELAPPATVPEPAAPPLSLPRGFVRFTVEPIDAAVYLDGEFLAEGGELARLHGALAVAAGDHRVQVVRPGYRATTREIRVDADGTATIEIRLERE